MRAAISSSWVKITLRLKFCCHSKYEGTDFEELALDIGFHPVDQTDAGKLAREVGLSTTRDNGLVPNQKKRRDDALDV